eukprot:7185105-Prorocentrum_lima.AAC.1
MTSSLVGSEMCIRDRPSGHSRRFVWQRSSCSSSGFGTSWSQRPVPSRHCLLYTSDAADDM